MFTIEYCPSLMTPSVHRRIALTVALTEIKTVRSDLISYLRTLSKEEYHEAKKQLPTYHFNGVFKEGSVSYDTFEASSGLLHFDIDHLTNTQTLKRVLPMMVPSIRSDNA